MDENSICAYGWNEEEINADSQWTNTLAPRWQQGQVPLTQWGKDGLFSIEDSELTRQNVVSGHIAYFQTMTSLEIAELTGKQHKDVLKECGTEGQDLFAMLRGYEAM